MSTGTIVLIVVGVFIVLIIGWLVSTSNSINRVKSFVLVFCLAVIFSLANYFLKKFEFIPLSFDFFSLVAFVVQ